MTQPLTAAEIERLIESVYLGKPISDEVLIRVLSELLRMKKGK
jgi:hypothetical protein